VTLPDPKPATLVRFHFAAMVFWTLLAVPTVVFWRESILWVSFMSLYAIVASHFSGWDAARAEEASDN
jgi:hypothetical protein